MNKMKFIHPKTGEQKTVKVSQSKSIIFGGIGIYVADAIRRMKAKGFVPKNR